METKMYDGGTGLGVSILIPKGEEDYYKTIDEFVSKREQRRAVKFKIANLFMEEDEPQKEQLRYYVNKMRELDKDVKALKKLIDAYESKR